jgi:chemotaxis protein methyltransferase CheR
LTRAAPTDAFGVVTALLGFRPEPTRSADVELAVRDRLKRRSVDSLEAYASILEDDTARAVEARALADRLTVNETYFFREDAHHAILRDVVLPEHRARGTSPLRILSLGCSSGEEPYGIAIKLHELGLQRADVRIVAIDASAAAIARAERAEFSPWSLRNVNEDVRRRYFTRLRGDAFALSEEIRPWVRFSVRNLLDTDHSFFEPDSYDVVFCRNVLIYFTPEVVRGVIATIANVLRPSGTLFLGHAETTHAGRCFATRDGHGGFYFTKRDPRAEERARAIADMKTPLASPRPRRAETPTNPGARPLETKATEVPPSAPSDALEHARERSSIEACLGLIRAERFDEALAALDAEATTSSSDMDVVRAALLTNKGEVARARDACARVLADRSSNAEAHYLLGLCDELEQRADTARQHYMRAAALDEDFAIPRMRLGILARKSRKLADARRLLGDALRLFPHQTERAVLIFGGGFHADALTRLCRSELDACKKT